MCGLLCPEVSISMFLQTAAKLPPVYVKLHLKRHCLTVALVRTLNLAHIILLSELHLFQTLSLCADFKRRLKSEP